MIIEIRELNQNVDGTEIHLSNTEILVRSGSSGDARIARIDLRIPGPLSESPFEEALPGQKFMVTLQRVDEDGNPYGRTIEF